MDFLELFTLKDVFIAASGLMIASIIRIYYASYVEKKKVSNFAHSLTIYNTLHENAKAGLIILSADEHVLFVNQEAGNILNTPIDTVDNTFLSNISLCDEYSDSKENFIKKIQVQEEINNVYIEINTIKIPLSIEVNQSDSYSSSYDFVYIISLRDMTGMNKLKEEVAKLLD